MADAADIALVVRKGRTFSRDFQLMTAVINDPDNPIPRDVTGATFEMQFKDIRGSNGTLDLEPTFTTIDLSIGKFNFTEDDVGTGMMATTQGVWEVVMTLSGVVTTEFEGAYRVILPVVS